MKRAYSARLFINGRATFDHPRCRAVAEDACDAVKQVNARCDGPSKPVTNWLVRVEHTGEICAVNWDGTRAKLIAEPAL